MTKQGPTTKDKDIVEHEFELVDLEAEDKTSSMQQTIRDKYYKIKELTINMERTKYVISFLEQENSQLKAKELIMEKKQAKLLQQVGKGKEIIESSEPEGSKGKGKRKRPTTKSLKKDLQEEEKHILLNEDLDLEDKISLEVH